MSNRAGIFVTAPLYCRIMRASRGDLYWLTAERCETLGRPGSSFWPRLFQWWWRGCVKTLSPTAPLSVYTLMFSYFTASDIFMEENLFILGTKLDLIINKLCRNNKLIINIQAEKVSPSLARPCYLVFISSPRMIVISSAGWRIIYLV